MSLEQSSSSKIGSAPRALVDKDDPIFLKGSVITVGEVTASQEENLVIGHHPKSLFTFQYLTRFPQSSRCLPKPSFWLIMWSLRIHSTVNTLMT